MSDHCKGVRPMPANVFPVSTSVLLVLCAVSAALEQLAGEGRVYSAFLFLCKMAVAVCACGLMAQLMS